MACIRGRYESEDLLLDFSAESRVDSDDPTVYFVENVTISNAALLGIPFNISVLPEAIQAAMLELGDEVDYNPA